LTHGERSLEEPISSDSSDAVTDNLRELAAAANAMQGEHIVSGFQNSPRCASFGFSALWYLPAKSAYLH
jgi:hypothetical protein